MSELSNEDREIAEKVKTGEYFREARQHYAQTYLDPMSERYTYIVISLLALFIFIIGFGAMQSLFPLTEKVPFIIRSDDLAEEYPSIQPLRQQGEPANAAIRRFLINNYVVARERYDSEKLDKIANGIQQQSSKEAFAEYEKFMSPSNEQSPLNLYQRQMKRNIKILQMQPLAPEGEGERAEVVFEAQVVRSSGESQTSRHVATVRYQFTDIAVSENSDRLPGLQFTVLDYRSKRLPTLE